MAESWGGFFLGILPTKESVTDHVLGTWDLASCSEMPFCNHGRLACSPCVLILYLLDGDATSAVPAAAYWGVVAIKQAHRGERHIALGPKIQECHQDHNWDRPCPPMGENVFRILLLWIQNGLTFIPSSDSRFRVMGAGTGSQRYNPELKNYFMSLLSLCDLGQPASATWQRTR